MEWDDLRYILAASRSRTLTGAARELGVTHTTVGRRLRAAEARLGVRLFERAPEGLHATPAGQELVEVAERLEGELFAAESRIMGRDAQLRGPLRVSTFDYAVWLFPDAFGSFLRRYPSVDLTLTATLDPVSLTRREADVALRLTEEPPESLIGRRIGLLAFAVYASTSLIERVGADAPYACYPWLAQDERQGGRWVEQWLSQHAPGAKIAARIDESAILRQHLIREGVGVFFLPCSEGDALADVRRLGPIQFSFPLWLLTLPDLKRTSRVRAFLDHMTGVLTAHPAVTVQGAEAARRG